MLTPDFEDELRRALARDAGALDLGSARQRLVARRYRVRGFRRVGVVLAAGGVAAAVLLVVLAALVRSPGVSRPGTPRRQRRSPGPGRSRRPGSPGQA